MGRRRLDESIKRNRFVGIRLTKREHDALSAAAAAGGSSVSELIRVAAIQWARSPRGASEPADGTAKAPPPDGTDAALEGALLRREIRRLGNNVNQLLRIANAGGDVDLRDSVDELRQAVETAAAWRPK